MQVLAGRNTSHDLGSRRLGTRDIWYMCPLDARNARKVVFMSASQLGGVIALVICGLYAGRHLWHKPGRNNAFSTMPLSLIPQIITKQTLFYVRHGTTHNVRVAYKEKATKK